MAAGRWVGRGRRTTPTAAAVDAMRRADRHRRDARHRRHRRGREGRRAHALQRRAGRRRHGRRVRRRRRPDRRHPADRDGHDQRDLGARGRRARFDVRPVRGVLHGEAGDRRRRRAVRRHQRAGAARTSARSPRRRAARTKTSRSWCSTGRATSNSSSEIRDAGARIKFILDGDVAGAIMAAREGTGVDLLLGVGGTPEGIIAACAVKCLGGVIQGKLWPRDDAERAEGHRRRARPRPGARHRRPGEVRQRLLRRHRHHRRRAAARRALPRRRRRHQSLVMRSKSGTIRTDRERASAVKTARLRDRRLRPPKPRPGRLPRSHPRAVERLPPTYP